MLKETQNTTEEMVENQTTESSQQDPKNEDPNKVVLLGTISYNNEEEYTKWLSTIDVNQAVFVLIAGANFSQAKGAYNLSESELISAAIRSIKKNSTGTSEASTKETTEE
jgi:hypothetical protein